MKRLLWPLLAAAILIAPAFGQITTTGCGHSTAADFSPSLQPKADAFLASLKAAGKAQDKRRVAGMVRYPVLINMPKGHKQISTSTELIAEYDRLFTISIRKAIEEQTQAWLFANRQGVMISNGEVWFEEQQNGSMENKPRRRNLWVTDTLQWRRKPGSLSPRTCAGFSCLLFVASCLLNQLLPPVNAPSDRADPGKCQQRALCGR